MSIFMLATVVLLIISAKPPYDRSWLRGEVPLLEFLTDSNRDLFEPLVIKLGLMAGSAHYEYLSYEGDVFFNYSSIHKQCQDDTPDNIPALVLQYFQNTCKIAAKLNKAGEIAFGVSLGNIFLCMLLFATLLARTFGGFNHRAVDWCVASGILLAVVLSIIPWAAWLTLLDDIADHPEEKWTMQYGMICSVCTLPPLLVVLSLCVFSMYRNNYFSRNGYSGPSSALPPVELEYAFDGDAYSQDGLLFDQDSDNQ
ncbi:MAG: hypothetical protein Q8P67_21670 [archaeon]|nr:hypothetical protein [archaeon]